MKNNTKIRLHLSKHLFETIAKEVILEAKKQDMSGGAYTEAVKMPKAKKSPEVKATDKMKKMEEMSSKEKMAKGLYKEEDMEEMQINVAEEDVLNEMDPNTVMDILGTLAGVGGIALTGGAIAKWQEKLKQKNPKLYSKLSNIHGAIDKARGVDEMETLNEMDPNTVMDILGTLAGVGGIAATGAAIAKWQEKLKQKNPKLYSKLSNIHGAIDKARGVDEQSISLNELRKQIKK